MLSSKTGFSYLKLKLTQAAPEIKKELSVSSQVAVLQGSEEYNIAVKRNAIPISKLIAFNLFLYF